MEFETDLRSLSYRVLSDAKKINCFQVVWKNSKRIGAAYATGNDGSVVVVIRYSPPGNYVGEAQFRNNVFPAKEEKQESGNQLSLLEENGGQTSCSCCIISLVIFAIITIRLFH